MQLKEELNRAKKVIDDQTKQIKDLKNQIATLNKVINSNASLMETLNKKINEKDQEINDLRKSTKDEFNNRRVERLYSFDQIMSQIVAVNFISNDQKVHYSIPCVSTSTFAEIEEKLYQEYPEYRETNNIFFVNGKEILRFKKINENNIKSGIPVTMMVPS